MLNILKNLGGISVAAFILAIAATVLAFIFIVPEKKRAKLNGFGKFLHNTLNFKFLIIEKILQALYIFYTALIVLVGFFMLFVVTPSYSYYGYGYKSGGTWLGGYGILLMILGPIFIRIAFEFLMMVVLLIKNVISINNKLKNQNGGEGESDLFATPTVKDIKAAFKPEQTVSAAQEAPVTQTAPVANFCTKCGAKLNPDGTCPNCEQ